MIIKTIFIRQLTKVLYWFIFIIMFNGKAVADNRGDNWELFSKETKDICNSVQNISIPLPDMSDETTKKALKSCDSYSLYYGFDNTPDYIKARECAFIKNHFDVLTMIYANGKGVKADLHIALHYACMIDDAAPAEMRDRINHLYKLKQLKELKQDFNICDDITSGYMMGVCASLAQRTEEPKQKKYLADLKMRLTPQENKAFKKLQNASANYFKTRLDNEMDRYGTGSVAFRILEMMNLKDQMIKVLNQTMQCKLPIYTIEQYKLVDNQLDSIYKKTQRKPDEAFSSITRNGIKITERVWIKYKDAWVNFGQIKCPNISVQSLKTLITKERINVLEELV